MKAPQRDATTFKGQEGRELVPFLQSGRAGAQRFLDRGYCFVWPGAVFASVIARSRRRQSNL